LTNIEALQAPNLVTPQKQARGKRTERHD
jgi:hypothetical protein